MSGHRRLTRPERDLLIRMFTRDDHPDDPAMKLLRRRGLARQTEHRIESRPDGAFVIERFGLTPRGVQVATTLTENRIGHEFCWEI